MKLKDKEKWDSLVEANQEGVGKAIIDYAEDWASLMESRIERGKEVADIAHECSNQADMGITGAMFNRSLACLVECWEHGDELHDWFKDKYGALYGLQ